MLGRSAGAVLVGIDARLVHVEVDIGGGLPAIAAVGLPDAAVREGIDRIRAALRHAGFDLPCGRVTVNLAPGELRKEGASLDLPIAAAILQADGRIPAIDPARVLMAGELGLDGGIRPVRGTLSIALEARREGRSTLLVPRQNADEAALVAGVSVVALGDLADLVAFGAGTAPGPWPAPDAATLLGRSPAGAGAPDLRDVSGQASARRALEIAAAGGHHLLLCGPPGSGKTMLARRMPGILPPLEPDEALEVTRVWSAAGLAQGLVTVRPFRAPHHGVSMPGLTGGGRRLRPGEMSLATRGVLYLDELTEFRRDALEALRQPLEEGRIHVVRVHAAVTLPARFILVASMNPCRCGYHGSPDGRCQCTPNEVRRYRSKISGPLLDRFDLVVDVPAVDPTLLGRRRDGEPSSAVQVRVVAARRRQRGRFGGGVVSNAQMTPALLDRFAPLGADARRLLLTACHRLGLSARAFDRVRRVARTIADLERAPDIEARHVAEVLRYRDGQGN